MQASLVSGDVTDVALSEAKTLFSFLNSPKHKPKMFRFALLKLTIAFLNPKRPVEGAILDRFAHMLGSYFILPVEIGYGARDF